MVDAQCYLYCNAHVALHTYQHVTNKLCFLFAFILIVSL